MEIFRKSVEKSLTDRIILDKEVDSPSMDGFIQEKKEELERLILQSKKLEEKLRKKVKKKEKLEKVDDLMGDPRKKIITIMILLSIIIVILFGIEYTEMIIETVILTFLTNFIVIYLFLYLKIDARIKRTKNKITKVNKETNDVKRAIFMRKTENLLETGNEEIKKGNFLQAYQIFLRASAIASANDIKEKKKVINSQIGVAKSRQNQEILNQLKSLLEIGYSLIDRNNFKEALKKFDDALEVVKKMFDSSKKSQIIQKVHEGFDATYVGIINEFLEKGNGLRAQKMFDKALEVFKKADNVALEVVKKMFDSSKKSQIIQKVHEDFNATYVGMINEFLEKGNGLRAQKMFDKALEDFKKADNVSNAMYSSSEKGQMINKTHNNFDITYCDMIEEITEAGNQIRKQMQYYEAIQKFEVASKIAEKIYDSDKKRTEINKIKSLIHKSRISKIKNTILNLGTKYTRLQIVEISEECGESEDLIISTVKAMIESNEIYARYFESSKSVVYDQQANIREIDELMGTFREWEEGKVGKIEESDYRRDLKKE